MPDPKRISDHIAVLEALNRTHFTPEELAELLGIGVSVVQEAVRKGDLQAFTVEHRIIDIKRSDAVTWLKVRRAAASS